MKVVALKGFSGTVTMSKGAVRDIKDKAVLKDLISCGYVKVADKEDKADENKRGNGKSD